MDSPTPTKSTRPGLGSRDSGTISSTATMPATTIGTLIRKTEPHQYRSSSAPPTTGPMATASPTAPAHTPMARARSRGSNTFEMIDSVAGRTAAAPMPMTARAAMSWLGSWAYAEASDARPNSPRPASRTSRRPYRSPSTPAVNSRPAKTRVYELTDHSSWLWLAPSPWRGSAMVRMATLRTVLSRTTTSRLTTSTPRMAHRRGCPVFGMGSMVPRSDTVRSRKRMGRYSDQVSYGTVSYRK